MPSELDDFCQQQGLILSIGPIINSDQHNPGLSDWAVELIRNTDHINFTVGIASADAGVHSGAIRSAAETIAKRTGRLYLGIETPPAPGPDASIGEVIETISNAPFGSTSTLPACANITDGLKNLRLRTCGYSGLMLPVVEDIVLAKRAAVGRYGIQELLLYSSVCGTGLDVVPVPGDSSIKSLESVIGDVAALSARYQKPLSARLFPIPGKKEGDAVTFDNPFLTDSVVMAID